MAITVAVLTTFPPTQCGLATFSHALVRHLECSGAAVGVVRVVDAEQPDVPAVVHQWVVGDPRGARGAAAAMDRYDVAIVQHEYGIFGGADGADVLEVLDRVEVPLIVVLHTVLSAPTPHQHEVLARVVAAASVVVTMTETARTRLLAGWSVDEADVVVIAHGAEDNQPRPSDPPPSSPPVILTWGLLGEGKGIEWALEAMAGLADLDPSPRYLVVGETHPRVVEREGEAYRERLHALVRDLGLSDVVRFDGRYLESAVLRRIVRSADVVLLPYDSRDQVTSGVLTEAVVAGKPVVSTTFPHAVELLSGGAGLLVPQRDPVAMSAALRRILVEPGTGARMAALAREIAPTLLWSAVADQYLAIGRTLRGARASDLRTRARRSTPAGGLTRTVA